jgi:hypothetical protein
MAQVQLAVLENGLPDRFQVGDLLGHVEPRRNVHVEPPAKVLAREPLQIREGGPELDETRAQRPSQADLREDPRDARGDEGRGFVAREARHLGAVASQQADPARGTSLRVDGNAGGRERLDVAMDGARRDFEPRGQLVGLDLAPILEEQEEAQQPVGAHTGSL